MVIDQEMQTCLILPVYSRRQDPMARKSPEAEPESVNVDSS